MVKVKVVDGKIVRLPKGSKEEGSFYIDGLLAANLDEIKNIMKNDWDAPYIIDGIEGSGKSVFAQQLAYYLTDGKLSVDDIVFSPKDFRKRVFEQKPFHAVIWDEAFRGLAGRSSLSSINRQIVQTLQECRQKNLYIFIILPSIWDLDKFAALHRTRGLFHVHVSDGWQRGYWTYYNNKEKGARNFFKSFFSKHTNRYSYPKMANLRGRFSKFYPIDKEAYLKKKHESLGDNVYKEKKSREERSTIFYKNMAFKFKEALKKYTNRSIKTICKEYELNYGTVSHLGVDSGNNGINNLKNGTFLSQNKEE